MRRYLENDNILINPDFIKGKKVYSFVKLPTIPLSFEDYYVYTTRGDRYDTLAHQFYSDSSFWWIIALCNPTNSSDSLIPEIGSQVRIPNESRIPEIMDLYSKVNINSDKPYTTVQS